MRYVNDEASRRLYAEFLLRRGQRDLRQLAADGDIPCWKSEIILAEDKDGGIIGGMSVLIRHVPFFGDVMVSPGGPVCGEGDTEALRQLIEGAELLAWKYSAMALQMGPDAPAASDRCFRPALEALGCRVRGSGAPIGEISAVYRPGLYRLYRLRERTRRSQDRTSAASPVKPLPLAAAGSADRHGAIGP